MRLSLPQRVRGFSPNKAVAVRPFSYSARNASHKTDILVELAKARRTVYQLGSNSPVPDSEIEKLVHAAILNVTSAFNTQSTRLLVLLHREHERLWDVAIDVFQNLLNTGAIPKEVWERQTLPKLQGFRGRGNGMLNSTAQRDTDWAWIAISTDYGVLIKSVRTDFLLRRPNAY